MNPALPSLCPNPPAMSSSPDSLHRRSPGLATLLLTLTLLGAPGGALHAQAAAAAPTASASADSHASAPAAVSITVAAPALTAARDLPGVRPPAPDPAAAPYGLQAVWEQGDPVARATLLILLVMSMASWYVLVRKLIEQSRLRRLAGAAAASFSGARNLREAADQLQAGSPFRFIAESSITSLQQHDSVAEQVDLNTWLTQNIERSVATVQSRSQDGLAILATVGATAPFVGLFGTVWGIYHALVKIGASGQASIDRVAGPVGEALIMTAIGLAVAVPAVLAYNWLVRRNRLAMEEVRSFGSELHTRVLATANASRRSAAANPEA